MRPATDYDWRYFNGKSETYPEGVVHCGFKNNNLLFAFCQTIYEQKQQRQDTLAKLENINKIHNLRTRFDEFWREFGHDLFEDAVCGTDYETDQIDDDMRARVYQCICALLMAEITELEQEALEYVELNQGDIFAASKDFAKWYASCFC